MHGETNSRSSATVFFFLNMNQRGFRSRSSVAARRSRSGQVNDLVEGVLSAQRSATGLETKCG